MAQSLWTGQYKEYENSGFMVQGRTRQHILLRFGTQYGKPMDIVED